MANPLATITFAGLLLTGALPLTAQGPATSTPATAASAPGMPAPTSVQIPGVPNRPDLVTVVPFYWKPNESETEQTKVVIPAEVDGRRGNFIVDLGAPFFCLNRTFLQPSPTGGVDTVTDANHIPERGGQGPASWDSVHVTVRIGTLVDRFEDPSMGSSPNHPVNAVLNHMWGNFGWNFAPRLGNIGLSVLEPFETIIDYPHRRLILIRLDKAGHRMVDVPAYTPAWSAPLLDLPVLLYGYPARYTALHFWGVRTSLGGVSDSLFFDTGSHINALKPTTRAQLTAHLADGTLDSLVLAGHRFTALSFQDDERMNVLGYPFLSQLGVVGFNHRTHQFIVYR